MGEFRPKGPTPFPFFYFIETPEGIAIQFLRLDSNPPSAGVEEEIPEPTVAELESWATTVVPEHRLYGWLNELPETEVHSLLETTARAYREFGSHMRWAANRVVEGRSAALVSHKVDGAVTDVEKGIQDALNQVIQEFDHMAGIGEEGNAPVSDARYVTFSDTVD